MKRHGLGVRALTAVGATFACITVEARAQEPGCRNGGVAAANVYVISNPIYAYYFGDLEPYVTRNAVHFQAGSDAIRCLAALSNAILRSSVRLYDPTDQRRREQLQTQLEAEGIKRGPQQSSPASELYATGMQMARLARGLPAAATGDFEPYRTPTNQLEELQIVAEQMFREALGLPEVRAVMTRVEPQIRELATIESKAIKQQAARLAGPSEPDCGAGSATAECALQEGTRALEAGNVAAARQAFLRMRRIDPSNERWPALEAFEWYKAGRLQEAEQANRRALAINPSSYTANDNIAFVLFDLGRAAEALRHWEAALAVRPNDSDALAGRAIALQSLRRYDEAVESYRRAVSANRVFYDCEAMRREFFWSTIACEAAAPLIRQVSEIRRIR